MSGSGVDYIEKTKEIMQAAEEQLRDLIGEAAAFGAYEATAKLAKLALSLSVIVLKINDPEDRDAVQASGSGPRSGSSRTIDIRDYPKFYRDGDGRLIVVGWSKKKGRVYKHKVQQDAVYRMAALLADLATRSSLIPVETIIAELRLADGTQPPRYYVDAYLRWLRHEKLAVRHGHKGYAVAEPDTLEEDCVDRMGRLRREPVS